MIEDLHPIRDTPIEVAFPAFCYFFGALRNCFKEDFDNYKKNEQAKIEFLKQSVQSENSMLTPEAKKIMKMNQSMKEKDL